MDIASVNYASQSYSSTKTSKDSTVKKSDNELDAKEKKTASHDNEAAVYEKSSGSVKKADQNTIDRLKADLEQRQQQLASLVKSMFSKQGKTLGNADEMFAFLRSGNLKVDPEVKAQAQADIAEDGYWGVNQTSDRLVSFAKALAGNDPTKSDELVKAIKKGFEQATGSWGDKLPDICQQTLDTTIEKMAKWRDGTE